MHGLPSRSGAELIDRLRAVVEARGIPILTSAHITGLIGAPGGRVRGLVVHRPDGAVERP